jgi:hypothetical protein
MRQFEIAPNTEGYIYCISDGYKKAAKIGFSRNPQRRLAQLQTASATVLELRGVIPSIRLFESFMHNIFRDRHIHGEWYDNSDEYVSDIFAISKEFAE